MSATPRSTSHSRRHSRRPTGSVDFTQMSVSPLTSATITEQDFQAGIKFTPGRRSGSYIQGLSAPSTPGILSRSHSFSRPSSGVELPKSKSASHLFVQNHPLHSAEWMHRTGAALTSETRESKGQSWLVSRESSTSLVRLEAEDESFYGADDEISPATPTWGRTAVEQEYESSDIELANSKQAEDDDDEDMYSMQGFGLGQFIDRLVGWSLFAEDSDDESADEYESATMTRERVKLVDPSEERIRRHEDDGWHDPSWIFDIATRVIF